MKPSIKKWSDVQLLLELDNTASTFNSHELETELSERKLSKKELTKAYEQKEYVQKLRTDKGARPLSLAYKMLLIIAPMSGISKSKPVFTPKLLEGEFAFLEQSGYKKKVQQAMTFRMIGTGLWLVITIALLLI